MSTQDLDFKAIRADKQSLVDALLHAGAEIHGNGRDVRCPFHEDGHSSGETYESKDGGWRFRCHAAGCGFWGDVLDVRAKMNGRTRAAEISAMQGITTPPTASTQPPKKIQTIYATREQLLAAAEFSDPDGGRVTNVYEYTNPTTKLADLIVFRIERSDGSKTFRQASPVAEGYVLKAPAGAMPLYNREALLTAEIVVVVEGEKAAHAVIDAGFVATTNPGGAGKAAFADWSPLSGKKAVYLFPDADPVDPKTGRRTGIEHMKQVAVELDKLQQPPALYWINCDRLDLPPKGDAYDFVRLMGEAAHEGIEDVLRQAAPMGVLADLDATLLDAVEGRRYAVPFVWSGLSSATLALQPGTVTIFGGSPGATKSLALLQNITAWTRQGIRVAALELEDGAMYHLRRAFAQIAGESNLTNDEWCKSNASKVRELRERVREELQALQHVIESPGTDFMATPMNLAAWIERKAATGCRVVSIDPITLMVKGNQSWRSDEEFLYPAKRIIERYGVSLILITHPRRLLPGQNRNKLSMDDLAGGACYSRFSQTVLYLAAHQATAVNAKTLHGSAPAEINRTLFVFKARNGRGVEGKSFGFWFDGSSLTLHERGELTEGNA